MSLIQKICPICNKGFETKYVTKKYCTTSCSYKAEKLRQKKKRDKELIEMVVEAKTEAKDLVPITEINVVGHQKFIGREIPVIEGGFGEGKRCLTDKAIAEIHNVTPSDIRKMINRNAKRFKHNVDFIDLKSSSSGDDLLKNLDFTKQQIVQAEHIYLLSERGYAKLIKIMDTDLAWEIHDELIDRYFSMRQELKKESNKRTLTEEEELTLKIVSGKADATDLKKYRDIIQLKALDGENAFLNCTQVVNSLEPYVPGLTTVLLHEWLEFKGLGVYRKIGNERGRTFQPNEAYMKFIAGEGHALTRRTTDNSKIYVQYTTLMVSRIMKKHLSSLVQFVNSRL